MSIRIMKRAREKITEMNFCGAEWASELEMDGVRVRESSMRIFKN